MATFGVLSEFYVLECAVSLLVLLLLPHIVKAIWRQGRIYFAFRTVPCDPDMHFLFGHAPKVSTLICNMIESSIVTVTIDYYLRA